MARLAVAPPATRVASQLESFPALVARFEKKFAAE
jgi:hypothetical protein